MTPKKFPIYIDNSKIFSNANMAFTFEDINKLGEKKEGKVIYSPYEAMFLIEKRNAQLFKDNKEISLETFQKILSKKDKYFYPKYIVFKHLKNKGYIVKEGLKFGGEFRIYEQHKLSHAKWICYVTNEPKIEVKEIISKIRITHSTGKKLLLAIVDKEEDIIFYEIDWVKP